MTLNVVCAGVWPRCVHCDGKLVASHLLEKVFLFLVMALLLHTLLTLAAAAGLRILAGEKPAEMPLLAGRAHADMFDWRQLQRWGISEDRLPPASLVRYKVPSTWKQYQGLIIGSSLLCGAEALLIIGLLLQRKRGRQSEGLSRSVLASLHSLVAVIDPEGVIVEVNDAWRRFARDHVWVKRHRGQRAARTTHNG